MYRPQDTSKDYGDVHLCALYIGIKIYSLIGIPLPHFFNMHVYGVFYNKYYKQQDLPDNQYFATYIRER